MALLAEIKQCVDCAIGTYSGATSCVACPAGQSSPQKSVSVANCTTCATGTISGASAVGGNLSTDVMGYHVHAFTATGVTPITFTQDTMVDVLIVAGGGAGGGGGNGGGGGAGGVIFSAGYTFKAGTYAVTVGDGGKGGVSGSNGMDSSIGTLFKAIGGGSGAGTGVPNAGGSTGGTCGLTAMAPTLSNVISEMNGSTTGTSGGVGYNAGQPFCGGGGGSNMSGISCTSTQQFGPGGDGMWQVSLKGSMTSLAAAFGSAYTSVADNNYIAGGGGGGAYGALAL